MLNAYSQEWFSLFLQPIQAHQTEREIAFLVRTLPQPEYKTILDIGCGYGRHSNPLGLLGYTVCGIDNNLDALVNAKNTVCENVTYLHHDMRRISELPGFFDSAINLWQSFGYFDENTNFDVLTQLSKKIRSSGRLIFDLYHREFFEKHQGERNFEKEGVKITEERHINANRLSVSLDYHSSGKVDRFEWQLYTPKGFIEILNTLGFDCITACTEYDEALPASSNKPRVQYVFEKRYGRDPSMNG